MAQILFVHTEVEQLGIIEQLGHLLDQIGADLIIGLGADHMGIVAQPGIVAGRKIQFGQGLEADGAQAIQFLLQLILGPSALDRDLGMGFILNGIAHVDQQGIEALLRQKIHHLAPYVIIA